jgi:hypothetical protein
LKRGKRAGQRQSFLHFRAERAQSHPKFGQLYHADDVPNDEKTKCSESPEKII